MQDSERRIQDFKVGVGRLLPAVVMGVGLERGPWRLAKVSLGLRVGFRV